jgi:hypothetical protein
MTSVTNLAVDLSSTTLTIYGDSWFAGHAGFTQT